MKVAVLVSFTVGDQLQYEYMKVAVLVSVMVGDRLHEGCSFSFFYGRVPCSMVVGLAVSYVLFFHLVVSLSY
jgi:hypothetical protein